MSSHSICLDDGNFGPVSTCRFFDFTLTFSNSILSLLPSSITLLALSFRLWKLSSKPKIHDKINPKYSRDGLGIARVVFGLLNMIFSLVMLAVVAAQGKLRKDLGEETILAALSLSFIVSILVPILSFLERSRTRGGSLFCLSASLVIKGAMLAVENSNGVKTHSSRESRASFFSSILFLWLLPLIWKGYRGPLRPEELDDLQQEYDAKVSFDRLSSFLFDHSNEQISPLSSPIDAFSSASKPDFKDLEMEDVSSHHHSKAGVVQPQEQNHSDQSGTDRRRGSLKKRSLILATFLAFPLQILKPIWWRLIVVAAQLSQPLLVSRTLSFAQSFAEPGGEQPVAYGWGLIGATALVYGVLGISTGQFFWTVSQSEVLIRGSYVSLIWEKSLKIDQLAASSTEFVPSSLMSVDIERIIKVFQSLHILWSGILTLIVGAYLLYDQLGLISLAPLVTIFLCIALTPIFSHGLGEKQSKWSHSSDERIGLLSSAVAHMKALKLSAYGNAISNQLIESRKDEGIKMKRFYNQLLVVVLQTNLVVEVLSVVTYGFLAYLTPERFTVNVVFTSLTLLAIVQEPLLVIGQQWASLLSAMSSLRRIEAFLDQVETPVLSEIKPLSRSSFDSADAVSFNGATLSYRSSNILKDVTLEIPSKSLTIVCGRVSSGKSTFLNAVLGELHVREGVLERRLGKVEYVSQDVWLQESLTIQDNIIFASGFDDAHYRSCLRATALDVDLLELDLGDRTVASRLSGGQRARVALARALYSRPDTLVLDDVLTSLDATTASWIWEKLFGSKGSLLQTTVVMATNALHLLPHAALVVRLDGGSVAESGRFSDLSMKGKAVISSSVFREEKEIKSGPIAEVEHSKPQEQSLHQEDEQAPSVAWHVYKKWIQASSLWLFIVFCFSAVLSSCGSVGIPLVLQAWSAANEESLNKDRNEFMVGVVMLCLSVLLFDVIGFWVFLCKMTLNSGERLHKEQLHGLMKTSISFSESGKTGNIINNFSQILFILDFEFPLAALNVFFNVPMMISNVIVISLPAPYLLLIFFVIAFIYVGLQKLYIPSSRSLRRLELSSKSPLYSIFTECATVQGLATIRSSQSEEKFNALNYALINASQKPFYYLWAARRWLLTSLNLLGMVINVALVLIVVLLRNNSSVGILGVSLVSATQIGPMLNRIMIAYSEMEIGAVAIEKIQQMSNLKPEEEEKDGSMKRTLEAAGVQGGIEIENLTVTYRPELEPSLKNFNVSIPSCSRVGVCGRSGSGKSTLLLALFGMLKPQSGRILLDGVDISDYSLESLRNSMTIISQTPLLLNTTIRSNLDPEGFLDDLEIWDAIQKVQLTSFVKSLPGQLEAILSGKVNTTPGQKQLLSLARAVLRKRKILVLDESSSALDESTDLAMQEIMATAFKNTTIIAVAHRIQTIRDYDQILVMSNGVLVEEGAPNELLSRPDSIFRSLAIEQRCA